MNGLLLSILGTLFGGVTSFVTGRFLNYFQYRYRLRGNLKGNWISQWETKAKNSKYPKVVSEEASISVSWLRGKVKITNAHTPGSKSIYTAYGEIFDSHMIGKYVSMEGTDGTFMLTISPNYEYMYGYWMGKSFDSLLAIGEMVIGIDKNALDCGTHMLNKMKQKS